MWGQAFWPAAGLPAGRVMVRAGRPQSFTRRSLLCSLAAVCQSADKPPNFTGTWMHEGPSGPEFQVIDQNGSHMNVVAVGGEKSADRDRKLSADGMLMTASGKSWKKQDSLAPGDSSWFTMRDQTLGSSSSASLDRGAIAASLNDLPQAERILSPLAATDSLARAYLSAVRDRNALIASVTHRAYAKVQTTRDALGRMLLPISLAGVEATYLVDTGSSKSLIGLAEAMRLGLKIESRSGTFADLGGGRTEGHVAIVPALSVGDMRLRSFPLWVVDDGRLGMPGVLGMDLLVAFQTVRWNPAGSFEIGFPAQPKDPRRANLYFERSTPIVEATSAGQRLNFILDTGLDSTDLFPRFATAFPDLIAANPKLMTFDMAGWLRHSPVRGVVVPEVKLRISGLATTLTFAHILLQKPPLWNAWHHGAVGLDVLNRARSATLDFQAMRLTLD